AFRLPVVRLHPGLRPAGLARDAPALEAHGPRGAARPEAAGPGMSFVPLDHEARERARRDFATSLVVEAGAGTGKTTLLVDRIEALVCSGTARLTEIAAVTFTENAATTMKLRLRERLERARAGDLPAPERARAAEAL